MKVIMESWDKFLNEEKPDAADVFYQVHEEKDAQRGELLNEVLPHVEVDIPGGRVEIKPIGKWGGLVAMTGITAFACFNIALINAPASVAIAFYLSQAFVPMAITAGIIYFWRKLSKLVPKNIKKAFDKFSEKRNPLRTAEERIKEMVDIMQEKAGASAEQAKEILSIINREVNEDPKCKELTEKLMDAINRNDSDETYSLSNKLDQAQKETIQRLQAELKGHIEQHSDEEGGDEEEFETPPPGVVLPDDEWTEDRYGRYRTGEKRYAMAERKSENNK